MNSPLQYAVPRNVSLELSQNLRVATLDFSVFLPLRVLAGGILNFSGTLLDELIFSAQGDVLGILVHFWGS